ncbi:MAG: GMC oxidoreductase [Hyphomicrobium sp.]|jgi:choline dehydrogenase-like flavoprotein
MLRDLALLDQDKVVDCEVCVVGGGAVGLAMAVQLARNHCEVVLLEAGGTSLEQSSQDLQRGTSVGHPFENIHVGRYRVLGGSTTFWGGQVVPLGAHAMQSRPWLAPRGWPIVHEDLEPYYDLAYRLLGLGSVDRDDARVWSRLGLSADLDESLVLGLTRWLPQRNLARLFRQEIDADPRLQAFVHANVTGLVLDERRRRVERVEARSLNGKRITVRAPVTVLACGSLEIARLLLHEAADGGARPWQENPWVGRGYLDHINGSVADVEVLDYDAFHQQFDSIFLDGFKFYPVIRMAPARQAAEQTTDIVGQFSYDTEFTQHLDYIKMFLRSLADASMPEQLSKFPRHALSAARIAAPLVWRYLRQGRSYKPRNANVRLGVVAEQFPNPLSQVRLGQDKDALGLRRLAIDWQLDGREVHSIAVFTRAVRDFLQSRKLARVHIDPDLEQEHAKFLQRTYDGIHQMGTTRMGHDASDGVVDRNLKVYGTDNLFVAGQAVFPVSGFANPTFTGIALGLRLCDYLRQGAHEGNLSA